MKKNKFSILKLILFLIFFLAVLALFLVVYIIPVIKKYKTNKLELSKYEKIYKKQKNGIKFINKKKEILKNKYKKSLIVYEKDFNKNDFENFIKSDVKNAEIKYIEKNNRLNCKITGKIDSINNLEQLIDKINNYKNLVKIIFPLTIKKVEKSYFVSISVTIINKNLKNNL